MKIKVIEEKCIGCGNCENISEELFKIEDDGLAHVILKDVPTDLEEDAMDAIAGCPTDAIEED